MIKTRAGRYPAVEAAIRARHPYELPEILAVPVVHGLEPYLRLDRRRNRGAVRSPVARFCGAAAALVLAIGAASAQEPKLLPNDRAFAFSARGIDDRTVEARFVIADGVLPVSREASLHAPSRERSGRPSCRQAKSRKTSSSARWKPTAISSSSSCRSKPRRRAARDRAGGVARLRGSRCVLPAAGPEGHADPARRRRPAWYARRGGSKKDRGCPWGPGSCERSTLLRLGFSPS